MPRQGVASCFSTWPGQLTFYHKDQGSSWHSLVPGRHSGAPVLNKMVWYDGLQIRDEFPQIHGWRIRGTTATAKSNLFPKIQCLLCKRGEVAPLSRIHIWPRLWRSAALALRWNLCLSKPNSKHSAGFYFVNVGTFFSEYAAIISPGRYSGHRMHCFEVCCHFLRRATPCRSNLPEVKGSTPQGMALHFWKALPSGPYPILNTQQHTSPLSILHWVCSVLACVPFKCSTLFRCA
jgi:hypothetical protein